MLYLAISSSLFSWGVKQRLLKQALCSFCLFTQVCRSGLRGGGSSSLPPIDHRHTDRLISLLIRYCLNQNINSRLYFTWRQRYVLHIWLVIKDVPEPLQHWNKILRYSTEDSNACLLITVPVIVETCNLEITTFLNHRKQWQQVGCYLVIWYVLVVSSFTSKIQQRSVPDWRSYVGYLIAHNKWRLSTHFE